MKMETQQINQALQLSPNCEFIDASNAAQFKALILPQLNNHVAYIIDLASVKFVDSTGLGALVSCLRKVEAQKSKLCLSSMNPAVRTLFEMVRLYKIFDIYDSPDEAARALESA